MKEIRIGKFEGEENDIKGKTEERIKKLKIMRKIIIIEGERKKD